MNSGPFEVRSLMLARANRVLVRDLSFAASPGQLIAVIGRNGFGKSTLLRALCGLLAPEQGSVLYSGKEVSTIPLTERARLLAFLPAQQDAPFAYRVREMVQIGRFPWHRGSPGKSDWLRVDEALETLQISNLARRAMNELSDGERQKVGIARVAAGDAQVWFLDEPLAHLDPGMVVFICKFLADQASAGKTIFASLHHLELVCRYAHFFIGIGGAATIRCGASQELTGPVVAELFGAPMVDHIDVRPGGRFFEFK
jgi:iron complex transport system ATP-binding protein